MPEADASLLAVSGVSSGYGRGDIVRRVSLRVNAGEICTVIGPNGAGKSTLIKTIAGLVQAHTGSIRVAGRELAGLGASRVALHGVAYVPQEANVFRQLTVRENLEMGAWLAPQRLAERLAMVEELFPALRSHRRVAAGNLSGGQRQMVAFAMALMVDPQLLLLDEPSAGLSPVMVQHVLDTVRRVNQRGVAVLMVEQSAIQALRISHRGIVMASGEVRIDQPASAVLENTEVGELYLGTRE